MSFLLAHLSDAHIGPIPRPNLAELLGKRATGYVNWLHKRAAQHDMPLLARLVDDLLAQKPDHVAMTGDIVNIGLSGEIALAREWLGRLGAPEQVSFSPGNHDAYVPRALALLNETFAPWSRGDDGAVGFPYLRRRDGVALIGLSSGVPTAPFVASGRLGTKQCADLAALLERTEAEGLARVVLLHHPPHRGGARALRGLDDAGAFEDVIAPAWRRTGAAWPQPQAEPASSAGPTRKGSRRGRRFRLGEGRDASAWRRLSFVFDFARGRAVGHQGQGARRRQRERRIGGFGRARVVTPRVAFELFRNKLPGR